jgi:nifR3 family TIM-barrel protein
MAGITDLPFRQLVRGFGVDGVFSEMVASQQVVQGNADMRARAELGLGAEGTVVQLAGRDPAWMAEAARFVAGEGARRIDINMGCPARKVVGGLSGSALMRDLDHALTLIEATVRAAEVPVSVKMRLGWDHESINAAELARRAEAAGVSMLTVHGRTRCQFYEGRADWTAIGAVVAAVSIPVVANGDIVCAATARQALVESGADGVMIGRGVRGRPWLPSRVVASLGGPRPCGVPDLASIAATHYEAALAFHGRELGVRTMRKHLGWYLDAADVDADARAEVLRATDPAGVMSLFRLAVEPMPAAA